MNDTDTKTELRAPRRDCKLCYGRGEMRMEGRRVPCRCLVRVSQARAKVTREGDRVAAVLRETARRDLAKQTQQADQRAHRRAAVGLKPFEAKAGTP